MRRLISPSGEVVTAGSRADAERELRASIEWTALFVDVRLPDGSGLDLLALARDLGCGAPALVLTALHEAAEINRAFALDARFLVKPAEAPQILAFVKEAMAKLASVEERAESWSGRYQLTPTEQRILVAAAQGTPRDDLMEGGNIANATLKKHVHNLLRKTGDPSLLAAAVRMLAERPSG